MPLFGMKKIAAVFLITLTSCSLQKSTASFAIVEKTKRLPKAFVLKKCTLKDDFSSNLWKDYRYFPRDERDESEAVIDEGLDQMGQGEGHVFVIKGYKEVTLPITTTYLVGEKYVCNMDEFLKSTPPVALQFIHSPPNTANGVDVVFTVFNLSKKTIKYVHIDIQPVNAVGDIVADELRGNKVATGKMTGPIPTIEKKDGLFEAIVYHPGVKCLKISSVKVDYMDGSTMNLKPDEIREGILPGSSVCKW